MLSRRGKLSFKKVKKKKKKKFSKGISPWFLSKNGLFHFCFFFRKIRQISLLRIILDRRECFLDKKKKFLESKNNSTIFKGISPWFLSKKWPF